MKKRSFIFVAVVVTLSLLLTGCKKTQSTTPPTPVVETVIVTATPAPTETSMTTPTPTVEMTESETEEPNDDEVVPCDTIQALLNGVWTNVGEKIDTDDIGNRITFTARSVLIPSKNWNETLSSEELEIVEQTWLNVRFNVCNTYNAVVFAGGVELGEYLFDQGVLFDFGQGIHTLRIRNAEIILWADVNHMVKDIEGRMTHEIRNGNFDITSRLDLAVSDTLTEFLPEDIAQGVQIVVILE